MMNDMLKYHIMYVDESDMRYQYDILEYSESKAVHRNPFFDHCAVVPVCRDKNGVVTCSDIVKVVKEQDDTKLRS